MDAGVRARRRRPDGRLTPERVGNLLVEWMVIGTRDVVTRVQPRQRDSYRLRVPPMRLRWREAEEGGQIRKDRSRIARDPRWTQVHLIRGANPDPVLQRG